MVSPLPTLHEIEQLHHKYALNDTVYKLVYTHCKIVSEIALWCATNINEPVDRELLERSALLHDIGSYAFYGEKGENLNPRLYPQHAILGARILADEGIDKRIVDVVSTHVLLGLTKKEIAERPWPLPDRNYEPSTLEGELLCYADRFHSKHPTFNAYDTFLVRLEASLPLQAVKFQQWSRRFGIPDVQALAHAYDHPVR